MVLFGKEGVRSPKKIGEQIKIDGTKIKSNRMELIGYSRYRKESNDVQRAVTEGIRSHFESSTNLNPVT